MSKIESFWESLECPAIDAVFRPNESASLLQVDLETTDVPGYVVKPIKVVPVSKLIEEGIADWAFCAVLSQNESPDGKLELVSGEGSYGSDGFVAVREKTGDRLLWVAYFLDSNPFDQVEFCSGFILARSTLGDKWRIELGNPENIIVEGSGLKS